MCFFFGYLEREREKESSKDRFNELPEELDVILFHSNFVQAIEQEVGLHDDEVLLQLLLGLQSPSEPLRFKPPLEQHHVKRLPHPQNVLPAKAPLVISPYHVVKHNGALFIRGVVFLGILGQKLQEFLVLGQVSHINLGEDELQLFEP